MSDEKITVAGSGTDRETEPVTISVDVGSQPVLRRKQPPNERCACGSGRKYKKCCNLVDHERERQQRLADDLERKRRWETAQANVPKGMRRSLNPATAALLAMAAMAPTRYSR